MAREGGRFRLGLPGWIVVGAVLGVATGLFLGDRAAVLKPVGTAYVMLLEAVVYPYIICTLLYGLGRLDPAMALKLLKRSWPFYLVAWGATLGSAYLLSLALPDTPSPNFIDGTAMQDTGSLLSIILPSNIFEDLARNHVPAVVVLSILFGVALQKSPGKESLLNILDLVRKAGVRIWGWIVYMAPFAVFAMFADTAGTIRFQTFEDMLLYLGLFLAGAFLLAFWTLPGIVAALAPCRYKEIMADLRGAFVLSMVTTLSVVALPFIQEAASKLAESSGIEDESRDEIISAGLAINYPLGQLGNFFVYFFMLYAAVDFGAKLDFFQYLALPFMTLLSCVGSPTSTINAVDFLGSWLNLHGDSVALYIETMVVTRYGQVALSVTGFAFLTILMTQNYFGKMRVRLPHLVGHVALSAALLGAMALGGALCSEYMEQPYRVDYADFELLPETTHGVSAVVCTDQEHCDRARDFRPEPGESAFERIKRTKILRVGYLPDAAPFCYLNKKGGLVGYDVAFAFDLAWSLEAEPVFVPFTVDNFRESLEKDVFDIAMSGLYIAPSRLRWAEVSLPYHHNPLALIVPSERAAHFKDMDAIRKMGKINIAGFRDPVMETIINKAFPFAEPRVIPDYKKLREHTDIDVAVWTFCQAKSYASANEGFTAVRPKNLNEVVVFGYYLPPHATQLQRYVNHWIALRSSDGTMQRMADYWLGGNPPEDVRPRWSILRDVLHWEGK